MTIATIQLNQINTRLKEELNQKDTRIVYEEKKRKKPTNEEEINRDNFQIFLKIIGCKRNMYNVRRKSPDFL